MRTFLTTLYIFFLYFSAKSQILVDIEGSSGNLKIQPYKFSNISEQECLVTYYPGVSKIKHLQIIGDSTKKDVKSISNSLALSFDSGEVNFEADLLVTDLNKESQVGLFLKLYDERNNLYYFDNMKDIKISNLNKFSRFRIRTLFDKPISKIDWGFFISGKGMVNVKNIKLSVHKSEFSDRWRKKYGDLSLSNINYKRLVYFGKIWGFLKYHHPTIANNKINWDSVAVSNVYPILNSKNNKEFNRIISQVLSNLGSNLRSSSELYRTAQDSLLINYDSLSIDKSLINRTNSRRLTLIQKNYIPIPNHYVHIGSAVPNPDFSTEKSYGNMKLPTLEYRVLGLFRYWSAINYFYPYKYSLKQKWQNVLEAFLPKFISSYTELSYKRNLLLLNAEINDSHAAVVQNVPLWEFPFLIDSILGKSINWVMFPWKVKPYNGQATVMEIDSSFCQLFDICKGTVISKINGVPLGKLLVEYHQLISSGKETYKDHIIEKSNMLSIIPMQRDSLITIEYVNNSKKTERTIKYDPSNYQSFISNLFNLKKTKNGTRLICDSILYINPRELDSVSMAYIDSALLHATAVIIDFRLYPNYKYTGKILSKLISGEKPGIRFQWMDERYPGVLHPYSDQFWEPAGIKSPYKGYVLSLIDETSISQSEFWPILFRQVSADRSFIVGRASAGADGDVSEIVVPGGYQMRFSGIRVNLVSGEETFKVGVRPDYYVPYNLKDDLNNYDSILEKAINLSKYGIKKQ